MSFILKLIKASPAIDTEFTVDMIGTTDENFNIVDVKHIGDKTIAETAGVSQQMLPTNIYALKAFATDNSMTLKRINQADSTTLVA